ncbi:MAG: DUF3024 domain-containing protein [Pyrinomonadaceae bacterium]
METLLETRQRQWWPYAPRTRSRSLAAMVKEIDADEYGCFFG